MRLYTKMQSVIGDIYIVQEENKLVAIHLGEVDFLASEKLEQLTKDETNPLLQDATKQLKEYFDGERREFNLPHKEEGTVFQAQVWKELLQIPYGETRSYQDVAIAIGKEKAVRAIGQANKANKLAILIPCHRVIGKDKSLTGYAGKRINIKERLLVIEGAITEK